MITEGHQQEMQQTVYQRFEARNWLVATIDHRCEDRKNVHELRGDIGAD
jgi:hypothetical protein